MAKQWFSVKSGSHEVYRRVMRAKQGFITGTVWFEPARRTVHPHGRGDNAGPVAPYFRLPGSPPRAWGQ